MEIFRADGRTLQLGREEGMWDKRVKLTLGRMLETAVGDGTQKFALE